MIMVSVSILKIIIYEHVVIMRGVTTVSKIIIMIRNPTSIRIRNHDHINKGAV